MNKDVRVEPTGDTPETNALAEKYAHRLLPEPEVADVYFLCQSLERRLSEALKRAQEPKAEPVAWGIPNTAITGKKQTLMQVRLEIPSDDPYKEAMWVPLYTAPPTLSAQLTAERVQEILHYPECWDTAAYPTVYDALQEVFSCSTCTLKEAGK